MDMKYEAQQIAEDLAQETYNCDYDQLEPQEREVLYEKALMEWTEQQQATAEMLCESKRDDLL